MASPTSWKIYYGDGTTFSSEEGTPEAAPLEGVQAIAEHRDGRTLLHTGGEVYRWTGSGWRARPAARDVKRSGAEMELSAFKAIRSEAMEWLHGTQRRTPVS